MPQATYMNSYLISLVSTSISTPRAANLQVPLKYKQGRPNCRWASPTDFLLPLLLFLLSLYSMPVASTPHTSRMGKSGESMWGYPMPPMIALPRRCCPQTRTTLFRDDVSLPILALVFIDPHPRHLPSAFHHRCQPLLILEYNICQLWHLYSGPEPPHLHHYTLTQAY